MVKLWRRLFFGLLALVIAAVIALPIALNVFHQSGIHTLGHSAHIVVSRDCYIFENGKDGSTKSYLSINGYITNESFYGYMNLDAYPISYEDYVEETYGYVSGKKISIYNLFVDLDRPDWEVKYRINIVNSDPELIFVKIICSDGTQFTAVCGESEEDAINNYTTFIEKYGVF